MLKLPLNIAKILTKLDKTTTNHTEIPAQHSLNSNSSFKLLTSYKLNYFTKQSYSKFNNHTVQNTIKC